MKKQAYEVNGWRKFTEEDSYKHGCIGDAHYDGGKDTFTADTVPELVEKCRAFCGGTVDGVLLDSCDEDGRLDIQVTEDDDATPASESQIEAWKRGELRLLAACYTFTVELVTRETVQLTNH